MPLDGKQLHAALKFFVSNDQDRYAEQSSDALKSAAEMMEAVLIHSDGGEGRTELRMFHLRLREWAEAIDDNVGKRQMTTTGGANHGAN